MLRPIPVQQPVARNFGAAIVDTREVLEAALDIEDLTFLALVVDTGTGKPVFPEAREQMAAMLAGAVNSPEIRQRRRERLDWWSIAGRGVEIYDMLRVRPQRDLAPRHLPCDQNALKVLLAVHDAPYTSR